MNTSPSVKMLLSLGLAFSLASGATALRAANIALSPTGTPIMGYNTSANPSDFGTEYSGGEGIDKVNDNNLTSYVDDFGNEGPDSFVGITFSTPTSATLQVDSLNLYIHTFGDGGWFGVTGTGYNNNGKLDSSDLVAPNVQVTFDGTTWTTVAANQTYVTDLTGTTANTDAPETTFTLVTPLIGIEGIRLIGPNGGTATYTYDNGTESNKGFIGIDELQVEATPVVPEPSTYALMLGGLAFLAFYFRRQRA